MLIDGPSMMLINSLLANATDTHWDEFTSALERLNVRKAVIVRPSSAWSLHTRLADETYAS